MMRNIDFSGSPNTFILFWNPAISSCKMDDYQRLIDRPWEELNWSVWDYRKAKIGDRFFMMRCGKGKTGLCMSGKFISKPFYDEDWSGQGRDVHYVTLDREVILNPEYCPILKTKDLQSAFPDFDWTGGHSGRLIDPKTAFKLDVMWHRFINSNDIMFIHLRAARYDLEEDEFDDDGYEEED